jgi:hypothetical protein
MPSLSWFCRLQTGEIKGLVDSLPCTPKGKVSICPSNLLPSFRKDRPVDAVIIYTSGTSPPKLGEGLEG